MESVLLLNASYEPLRVISWQRAVTLLFMGKIEIVEEYDHHIHSVSFAIKAPAVVRLLSYIRIGQKSPPLSRINILARDQFECQYCSQKLTAREATIDHVVPRSRGGHTVWENVVTSCSPCNRRKGSHTPQEARMTLRTKPAHPEWLPVLTMKLNGQLPESWHDFLQPSLKR